MSVLRAIVQGFAALFVLTVAFMAIDTIGRWRRDDDHGTDPPRQ